MVLYVCHIPYSNCQQGCFVVYSCLHFACSQRAISSDTGPFGAYKGYLLHVTWPTAVSHWGGSVTIIDILHGEFVKEAPVVIAVDFTSQSKTSMKYCDVRVLYLEVYQYKAVGVV